jgi:hypothetical protein
MGVYLPHPLLSSFSAVKATSIRHFQEPERALGLCNLQNYEPK